MPTFVALPMADGFSTRREGIRAGFIRAPLAAMEANPFSLVGFISNPTLSMVNLPTSICSKIGHPFSGRFMSCRVTGEEVG